MRRLSDREIECLIELWHVEDWRRRAFTHVNGRWSAVTDVDVRPLGALTSVNVHSVNRPLYKCRRSCATAYSWRPVGQPRWRRHSHLCRFRVVADRHCWSANNVWHHLCTCPCRLFRYDRRPAVPARLAAGALGVSSSMNVCCCCTQTFIDELTPVSERVAFMHRILSYHIAISCVISIVSYRFRYGRIMPTLVLTGVS